MKHAGELSRGTVGLWKKTDMLADKGLDGAPAGTIRPGRCEWAPPGETSPIPAPRPFGVHPGLGVAGLGRRQGGGVISRGFDFKRKLM